MNNWPRWVNWGLIFLSVAILGVAIKFQCPTYGTCPADYLLYPVAPVILVASMKYVFIAYFIFYFLLGALLGFIYSKIKDPRAHPAAVSKKDNWYQTPFFTGVKKIEEELELALDETLEYEQEDIRKLRLGIVLHTMQYLLKIAGVVLLIVAPLFYYAIYPAQLDPISTFFIIYLGWLLGLAVLRLIYNNITKKL